MKKLLVFALAALSVSMFGAASFNDFPAELKNVPANKLIKFEGKDFGIYINGKRVKDPVSTSDTVVVWKLTGTYKYLPFNMGVYDNASKKGLCSTTVKTVPQNEKYNWYKVGTAKLGKNSIFHLTDWHISMNFKKIYKEGASNTYDVWVSLKTQGPAYVKGSKKANELAADRLVLVAK